ncbi:hypothetical protein Ato02nite_089040 [Paractinoplanes toevensis]|uniref:Uncharacterized protein n=1 Tax=Paractinoplanes toevensis TaxID=571911 RepID=A0A920BQX0_9ACTN|nr:hypothetical protein Ato02nite_089040 [Actinoplanes toevensis]
MPRAVQLLQLPQQIILGQVGRRDPGFGKPVVVRAVELHAHPLMIGTRFQRIPIPTREAPNRRGGTHGARLMG